MDQRPDRAEPPPLAAIIDVPKDFHLKITPDGPAFWVQVSREKGLIKGNPDPKSLIYP